MYIKESKYHKIDPLILQTLNLNQTRMKHIVQILHGHEQQILGKTHRKTTGKTYFKNQSVASITSQQSALPRIMATIKKDASKTNKMPHFSSIPRNKDNRVNKETLVSHSISANVSPQRSQTSKRAKNRQEVGAQSHRHTKHERSAEEQIINLEQQILSLQQDKKQQLMKDYMVGKLKRSKSQQINPKDIYRLQIENIISELTPIELLHQSEERMRRLKKKHKHLSKFDKNYYIKLNQHDMLILF